MRLSSIVLTALALVAVPRAAAAWPQPRDYFLDAPKGGTWVHLDAVTVGAQASLEHRAPIEDESLGMFHVRGTATGTLGFGELSGHTDLRVLGMLTLGGSVGYRRVWNNKSFPDGVEGTRDARRALASNAVSWPWTEARARLVIPLDFLWLVSNAAVRWEDQPDNTFDWFHTNMHDGGRVLRADATLFVRHGSFGGVGPTVRWMSLPRGGTHESELAYGMTLGTRIGAKRKNDLLLVQTLFRFGDATFGWHQLRAPVYAMVVYRASFEL